MVKNGVFFGNYYLDVTFEIHFNRSKDCGSKFIWKNFTGRTSELVICSKNPRLLWHQDGCLCNPQTSMPNETHSSLRYRTIPHCFKRKKTVLLPQDSLCLSICWSCHLHNLERDLKEIAFWTATPRTLPLAWPLTCVCKSEPANVFPNIICHGSESSQEQKDQRELREEEICSEGNGLQKRFSCSVARQLAIRMQNKQIGDVISTPQWNQDQLKYLRN